MPFTVFSNCNGYSGSGKFIIGPSPTSVGDCGNPACALTVSGTVTASGTSIQYYNETPASCLSVDISDNIMNVIQNDRTGEIFVAYDDDGALLDVVRGVAMNEMMLYAGIPSFMFAINADDPLSVRGEMYDLFALNTDGTRKYQIHRVKDGIEIAWKSTMLELENDEDGITDRSMQDMKGTVKANLAYNLSPEWQTMCGAGGMPIIVGNDPTTPSMYQAIYVNKSGMVLNPVAILVIPEYTMNDSAQRNLDGEVKFKDAWYFPRCLPNPDRTFSYKKGNQLELSIEYQIITDPVFMNMACWSPFLWRGDHYPSNTP